MDLERAVNLYLMDCELSLSPATVAVYRYALDSLVAFARESGAKDLEQVETNLLREFLLYIRNRPKKNGAKLSSSTLHQHYRSLRTFFGWCVREGYLEENPILPIRRPRLQARVPVHLSFEEIGQVVQAARETIKAKRNTALVLLLLDTGLRAGEVCALRIDDVDLEGRKVTVRSGKGGKGRQVPLSHQTVAALEAWLEIHPRKTDSLFMLGIYGLRSLMRRLGKRAGIGKLYPHALRHTFATHYEGSVSDLQMILGHADVSTTVRIYRHRSLNHLLEVHERCSPVGRLNLKDDS